MDDPDPTVDDGLALLGALAVAVGTYLPWIVRAPGADVVPAIYVPGMETGLAAPDYAVLAVLVVGLAAAAHERPRRRAGHLAAGTGLLVALVTGGYLGVALTGGGATLGAFAPGTGAYVTLAGASLLAAAGWRHASAVAGADGLATPG